jgi:hypothetical protein
VDEFATLRIDAVEPGDEGSHVPTPELLWNESWYFDFAARDGSLGGYVRVGRYPNLGVIWYWACLVGPDRPLVTLIDHAVVPPRNPASLELRGEGLWADHTCGTPLEHWNLGLEAFALALDSPADVYGDARGERVAFGFDLEWETAGVPYRYPVLDRYEVPCDVHGTVLVGHEELEFDGVGQRDHSWGVRDWWSLGWLWSSWRRGDGASVHAMVTRPALFGTGYVQQPGELHVVTNVEFSHPDGPEGIPPEVEIVLDGRHAYRATPLAWAPVFLVGPDGRQCRFPRAMCRFEGDDGDVGIGWLELGQPATPIELPA